MQDSIVSVGALIFARSTNRFLFLVRSNGTYSGTWGLVGGKAEAGETARTALLREIQEEISTDLSNSKIVPVDLFTSTNQKFTYNTYLVSVEDEFIPKLNKEHSGYAWCTLGGYPKPLHPGVWGTVSIDVIQQKIETAINV